MRLPTRIALVLLLCVGCSGRPGALLPPEVSPKAAAIAAIMQLDQSGDGLLSQDEWSASAALAAVAEKYDSNGDHYLDKEELRAGFIEWQENAVGPRPVPFTVLLNGRPLPGVAVRLVPAPFMGGQIPEASADANSSGSGQLSMSPDDMPKNAPKIPLVQPGLYSVEITHPSGNVPAKYNSQTTLGLEVTSANPGPQGVRWSLTTR